MGCVSSKAAKENGGALANTKSKLTIESSVEIEEDNTGWRIEPQKALNKFLQRYVFFFFFFLNTP